MTIICSTNLDPIAAQIKGCTLCKDQLPFAPRPVLQISSTAKLLIIGQAPGARVQATGIPWNDPSGNRLREWLNIPPDEFYNANQVAIMPMGFCYPGKGKSGDLPPRKECAPQWHKPLLEKLPNIQLTLLIGQYAQRYYLPEAKGLSLTQTVAQWQTFGPHVFPLPHPSPRNQIWLKRNPWFDQQVIPALRLAMASIDLTTENL